MLVVTSTPNLDTSILAILFKTGSILNSINFYFPSQYIAKEKFFPQYEDFFSSDLPVVAAYCKIIERMFMQNVSPDK